MRPVPSLARWMFVLLLLCCPLVFGAQSVPSVDRLVSLPKLDGTAPSRPAWSPDSQSIAFLWNDHGMPYRDLWLVERGQSPRRLTDGAPDPADVLGTGDDLSLETLRERARQRQHGGISDLVWHPDGSGLFYVLDGALHFVDIEPAESRRIGPGGGSLSVSPDGTHLGLIRDGDLWLKPLAGGDLRRLTELGAAGIGTVPIGAYVRPDAYIGRYRWAPDGRAIAIEFVDQRDVRRVPFPSYLHEEPLLHEVRRPYPGDTDLLRRVGVLDLDGDLQWLDLEAPDRRVLLELEWSPEGERLLIMQGADVAEQRWIFVAHAATGEVEQVWQDERPRRIYPIFRALWSADGEQIFFIGDQEDHYRLYALPASGGMPQRLSGDYDIAADWSAAWIEREPDSGDLLLVSTKYSPHERHVFRLPAGGGAAKRLTTLPGVHRPTLSPDGQRLALLRSSDTSPTELYWLELDGESAEEQLTQSPLPAFRAIDWLEAEYVSFPSRIDDYRIHARIIRPPQLEPGKRYPVMMGSIYSNTALNQWNPDRPTSFLQQQMALRGDYITVLVDVRGSVGYGVDFREAFQGDWGGDDLEDLHSAVDYLTTLDEVDPDRIGIWGNSYGGLLVLSALFTKPGLFAAGVAGAPAVDIWHFTGFDQHLTRRPDTHPEIFEQGSLLDLGEGLEDPLLIIHGVHDDIVPLKTTLMMAEKLKLLGKRFELDLVHDSGHWWAASEHYARYTFGRLEAFMHRHVPPGPK